MSCIVRLQSTVVTLFLALFMSNAVNAAIIPPVPTPGSEGYLILVETEDPIILTYHGTTAALSSDLFLFSPTPTGSILNNLTTPVGSSFALGTFPLGTELIFRIHVNNQNRDYFSGYAERNEDGQAHARVQANWQPGEALVGFEDLFAQAEPNYHDVIFSINGATANATGTVPIPASGYLFMIGLLMLVTRTRIS